MYKIRLLRFVLLTGLFPAFAYAQTVPIINVNQLDLRLENGADTTFVVNFWATWCGPCVKELPYFEALGINSSGEKFKVLLVTLDFVENLEPKVIPFISTKGIKSEVLLLDEGNPNEWIPRVSEKWSGAIPATIFVNTQKKTRHFHEGSFKEGELESKLQELGL
ncbi:MAG: TlpA family protein disulfide reductase [Flavobacteriales bacterium]|nr:TlpA family protein disulfide reductase [Flavobacteriales bacterium]